MRPSPRLYILRHDQPDWPIALRQRLSIHIKREPNMPIPDIRKQFAEAERDQITIPAFNADDEAQFGILHPGIGLRIHFHLGLNSRGF